MCPFAGVCAAFGASAKVEFDSMYPAIENHAAQTEVVKALGRRVEAIIQLSGRDSTRLDLP